MMPERFYDLWNMDPLTVDLGHRPSIKQLCNGYLGMFHARSFDHILVRIGKVMFGLVNTT